MQFLKSAGEAGFTFHEVLVAISITVVAVMGYSLSSLNVLQRQTASGNSTVAMHLAQDKLEELQASKALVEGDFCLDGGDHGISAKPGIAGIFDRCWKISHSTLGSKLKQIDVKVAWRDFEAREVTLSTLSFTGD